LLPGDGHRAIEKKRYHTWQHDAFGAGVAINPYVAAFALVARVVNDSIQIPKGQAVDFSVSTSQSFSGESGRNLSLDISGSMCRFTWITVNITMKPHAGDGEAFSGREFLTTNWSIVLGAGDQSSSRAGEAMQRLCQIYWYPLYAFIRQRGSTAHDAQDLTQEFFAQLLLRQDLTQVRREKGKFRSFLLASLQHFMANERKKAGRLKRGGGQNIISIDAESAERRYALEPSHDLGPDKLFERRWAMTLLDQAIEQLRLEFVRSNKLALFEQLKVFLTGDENGPAYCDLGAKLAMTEAAVKMAVSRLRRRYREILRAQIENTVAGPDDIEDEIRHLFTALG
jgi:RNA polymerase sigma-70 factor (ECF subfamily)